MDAGRDLLGWQGLLFFVAFVPLSYTIWTVSENLDGGVAAAVVVHAASNGADGLFPAESTVGSLIATAVTTGIAITLYALLPRHRQAAVARPAAANPPRRRSEQ